MNVIQGKLLSRVKQNKRIKMNPRFKNALQAIVMITIIMVMIAISWKDFSKQGGALDDFIGAVPPGQSTQSNDLIGYSRTVHEGKIIATGLKK